MRRESDQLHGYRTLHLFAGAGGGILADLALGHRPVCAVEIDDYCRAVLAARMADGSLPWFPLFADVRDFDGRPWRGLVDCVAAGFPCQDISLAGSGRGIDGPKSGLWRECARVVCEVGPRFVYVENAPSLTSRGLGIVLGDLATMGYDAEWGVFGAHHVGAPHRRNRIWIVAHANGLRELQSSGRESDIGRRVGDGCFAVPDADGPGCQKQRERESTGAEFGGAECHSWWATEPQLGRVDHGLADRLDGDAADATEPVGRVAEGIRNRVSRLKALGNGQVPAAAAAAWEILRGRIE